MYYDDNRTWASYRMQLCGDSAIIQASYMLICRFAVQSLTQTAKDWTPRNPLVTFISRVQAHFWKNFRRWQWCENNKTSRVDNWHCFLQQPPTQGSTGYSWFDESFNGCLQDITEKVGPTGRHLTTISNTMHGRQRYATTCKRMRWTTATPVHRCDIVNRTINGRNMTVEVNLNLTTTISINGIVKRPFAYQ